MLNLLRGRGRVDIYGIIDKRTPMVCVQFRDGWRNWCYYKLDMISFLLITEKLCEFTGNGDFVYSQMHEDVKCEVKIPAWAVAKMQRKAAKAGPTVYEILKQNEEKAREAAARLGDDLPDVYREGVDKGLYYPLEKYKKIHAKLNGYDYTEQHQDKVLH